MNAMDVVNNSGAKQKPQRFLLITPTTNEDKYSALLEKLMMREDTVQAKRYTGDGPYHLWVTVSKEPAVVLDGLRDAGIIEAWCPDIKCSLSVTDEK